MFSENPSLHRETLGKLLAQARTRLRLSQERLAEVIGATARSISRWEHNQAIPQQCYRVRLCQVLQIPFETLFGARTQAEKSTSLPGSMPIWYVPYSRNSYFAGREPTLLQLHERLHTQYEAAFTRPQIVSGLGGVGKTQIVLEYAYRFRQDYQAVLWVRAETPQTLEEDYRAVAHLLQIPAAECQDMSCTVAAVKHKLQNYQSWLFICDNVEDLEHVHTLLPDTSLGQVVLTTRSQVTGTLGSHIDVKKMEPAEGALFLLRRAKYLRPDATLEEVPIPVRALAETIVETLDGFPLALDQAGAYIEESECSFLEYLERYATRRDTLLSTRGALSNYHPASVTETLSLSFQQIEQVSPIAADLLRLCAFFHADAIPEELPLQGTAKCSPALQTAVADPLVLDAAIRQLRRASLLHRKSLSKTFTIHRLMQVVIRDSMDEQTLRRWIGFAIQALNLSFPNHNTVTAWSRHQRYLPHVLACATFVHETGIISLDAGELFHRAGNYLRRRGDYMQAKLLLDMALYCMIGILGPGHVAVVQCLEDLTFLCHDLGQHEQLTTFSS